MNIGTPIWIYDKDENLRLILNPNGDIPHYDSWYTEQLNGEISLEFAVPASDPRVALIENDGRAVIRDRTGGLVEFIIRKPHDIDGADGPIKRVFAEGGDYELIDEWMPGYRADNVALDVALQAVTSDTRWRIGDVDNLGRHSVNIKPTTVKNAIFQLLEIYGGEVRYRVSASGNRITNRYIDVFRQRGSFKGKRFEKGRDVKSVSYLPDSTGIKTALYGYGASGENDSPRLTFADVEWSVENGDPVDKPLGYRWVGDPEALEAWGYDGGTRHRFGEYSGQEDDAATLLFNTWNELQAQKSLRETFETDVALLENISGYGTEPVDLGDTVYVIDREIQPNIEASASIIEYRENLNDSNLDEVVIGQFRNLFDAAQKSRDNERILDEKQGNWDEKPTTEYVKNEAQLAIDEAQRRLDEATETLEQAVVDLENAMITLDEAMLIADDVFDNKIKNPQNYVGYFEGDVGITGQLHVAGTIVGGAGATIRGTLNAHSLNLYSANILNANIQNANITGTLNGVDGRFIGQLDGVDGTFVGRIVGGEILSNSKINVTTDLHVGENIYLGWDHETRFTRRGLIFHESSGWTSKITGNYTGVEIEAQNIRLESKLNGRTLIIGGLQVSAGDIMAFNDIWGENIHSDNGYFYGRGSNHILLSADALVAPAAFSQTYTVSTNMLRVSNSGTIGRSTSSRRFKLLEEKLPLEYAERILELDAVSWFDKRAAEDYAHTLTTGEETEEQKIKRIGGIIAEDVEKVGLEMFVSYDSEGKPDGIADNVWVLLLTILKDLRERVHLLEGDGTK